MPRDQPSFAPVSAVGHAVWSCLGADPQVVDPQLGAGRADFVTAVRSGLCPRNAHRTPSQITDPQLGAAREDFVTAVRSGLCPPSAHRTPSQIIPVKSHYSVPAVRTGLRVE